MKRITISPDCELYGKEIDRFTVDKDYKGLESYLQQVEEFAVSHDSPEYAPVFYYLGTGKAEIADNFRRQSDMKINTIADEFYKQSFYYFRKAVDYANLCENSVPLLLLIYTNYANGLDSCGRVIEAIRIYRKAINLCPSFGMAVGNYGRALQFYANTVNDSGHYRELHCYAYQAIRRALGFNDPNVHEEATRYFRRKLKEYEEVCDKGDLLKPIEYDRYELGNNEEHSYRMWCLENHLFLNPLNDLINMETAFAHDPLTISHYTEMVARDEVDEKRKGEPPKWFAMLNQLKEEYIYARFLCYEGSEKSGELHYADKEVKLSLASFDYANYSIRLEQLKSAYKTLFSIFDQIGFFINEFWGLGLEERKADAYNVFKHSQYPKDNTAMKALYWSACEFCERFGDAEKASEADLKTLRNALEHKFVKVHEFEYKGPLQIEGDRFYHISENELKKSTVRLLELAREWIMELVYAIGIEESKKDKGNNSVHMSIADYSDEWKL